MASLITCPHCGQTINVTPDQIADVHPNVARTWVILQHALRRGQRVGTTAIAELALIGLSTAKDHARTLAASGALIKELKREGGKYYVYRLP